MKNVLLLLLLLFGQFSYSAQFYIPNGDVAALKTAITATNGNNSADTIHLYPYGNYTFLASDNSFVLGENALPRIQLDGSYDHSLTVLGNGATLALDPNLKNVRILYFDDCKVYIYDVNFLNGNAVYNSDPGGAILLNGSTVGTEVNLYNCFFRNNSANKGGAIYVSSGNMNIDNCTFTQNNALYLGGAITNFSGIVMIKYSVFVNNYCTNTTGPGAFYNYAGLRSNTDKNIYLQNSIVALNTYENSNHPDNKKEFDLAYLSGIYTMGNNLIGSYDNTTRGTFPIAFVSGLPSSDNDYVGTSADVLDPKLGTLSKGIDFTPTYPLLSGSLALSNKAGNRTARSPKIASYGLFPQTASPGTVLTIVGKNLSNIVKIQFQGVAVTSGFTASDSLLKVTVPSGARTGRMLFFDANNSLALSDQEFKLAVITEMENQNEPQETVHIYPNPAHNELFVHSDSGTYTLCNLAGETVFTSDRERADLSRLAPGVYVIKSGKTVKKLVKE